MHSRRVAICQPTIIPGGRLSVILDVVRYLNKQGITPDILTSDMQLSIAKTLQAYGKPLRANLRSVSLPSRLGGDIRYLIFNGLLRTYASSYDMMFNTSNSLEFLPSHCKVLSYVFYPRKSRIMHHGADIHLPDEKPSRWSKVGIVRQVLQYTYRLSKPTPGQQIVCMTRFTRDALLQEYDFPHDLPIVYPAIDFERYRSEENERMPFASRNNAIVTIGRFSSDKRQLEQIQLAQTLPDKEFHIIGFVAEPSYYQMCERIVRENQIRNVYLHPDATFDELIHYLHHSKYFLHTLINEPFGLTAVQAIASGCVPIVHDSGGQRETVIYPWLRYGALEQAVEIVERIDREPPQVVQETIHCLQNHVWQTFSQEKFQRQIGDIIEPLIG